MKTIRYRLGNEVKPGILDSEDNIRDASSLVSDWDSDNVTVEKLSEIKSIDIMIKFIFKRIKGYKQISLSYYFKKNK